jgi:hypothetical protein
VDAKHFHSRILTELSTKKLLHLNFHFHFDCNFSFGFVRCAWVSLVVGRQLTPALRLLTGAGQAQSLSLPTYSPTHPFLSFPSFSTKNRKA